MENKEPTLDTFMDKLKEIIKERLDHPEFSIDHICLEMKASRAQLHRKVKAATGHSTSLFIRQMRMEQAKLLLGTTDQNISQIAYQVGISSPQNFSKYFIEIYGISPSAYRKAQRTGTEQPVEPPGLPEPKPTNTETPVTGFPQRRHLWVQSALLFSAVVIIGLILGLYYKKYWLIHLGNPAAVVLPFKSRTGQYPPTTSAEASQFVLRGRDLLRQRTQESLQESLHWFDQAIRADRTYSDAYLGKANALSLLVTLKYSADETRDLRKAEQLTLLAIKHNTDNAQAYAVLGNIYQEQYRWQEALTSYEIALKFNPHDALTNYWYSLALRSTGKLKQALHYNKIAHELDPDYSVITTGYLYTAIYAEEFGLADTLIQQATPTFKQSFLYPNVIGMLLIAKEQYESALPYFDTCQMMNPKYYPPEVSRIFCLGKLGKRQQVEAFLSRLDTTRARDCVAAATAYAGLGKIDLSVAYLQAAASKGEIPEYLLVDIRYTSLQVHPDFRQILKTYGLTSVLE